MVIHGDGRETIFNAFQGQIEVWMLISNFFEVRESFVRFRVNSRFARWLIVRHSCYPPRRATKPRCESHASKSFLKHTHGIDRMSIAATYSTEMRTNRRFARIAQTYTVRLSRNCSNVSRAREGRLTRAKENNNFPAKRLCSDQQCSNLAPCPTSQIFSDRTPANNATGARIGDGWFQAALTDRDIDRVRLNSPR